jgi:hypothetical protein
VVTGYGDNTFRPNNNVTRGQIAKIVSNMAGYNEPVTGQTFEDVLTGSTFYEFVERLASRGIVGGYPCGGPGEPCVPPDNRPYFRPNSNVTRGQASKIICMAAGCNTGRGGQTFEDVPPGSTFHLEIQALANMGAISGYPCGGPGEPCVPPDNRPYFRPGNYITRGQVSKVVVLAFQADCPATRR